MPAVLEDPASPTMHRITDPTGTAALPADIQPRQVTLRDRQTVATVVPFSRRHQLPASLLVYLSDQLNKEIEGGDTYPMTNLFTPDTFSGYWFQDFGAVMLLGEVSGADAIAEGKDWSRECLGSFYIRPNYPGRSSHICNAGFIVTDASRNRGVGRLMGESYLDWAPRLGYTYSVFNLVYETNVASCRIWDALGFKRIGRVKGGGNLRSHPDRLVDAIIYGRDLAVGGGPGANGGEEPVSEERFDKIRFYLKYNKYPNGADRAEKSRLRSAATHYKLLDDDRLMLKDKEVIADPGRQYDIARDVHAQHHGGINKTTATIAERYHWSRIKETVSDVIRNCVECRDSGKVSSSSAVRKSVVAPAAVAPQQPQQHSVVVAAAASAPSAAPNAMAVPSAFEVHEPPIPRVAIDNLIHASVPSPSPTTTTAATTSAEAVAAPAAPLVDAVPQDTGQEDVSAAGLDATSRVLSLRDHTAMMPTLSQDSPTPSPGAAYANPNDISVISPSQTYRDANHMHHVSHGHHHQHLHHHHHHHIDHHSHHHNHNHPMPMLHDHDHDPSSQHPHHNHNHHHQHGSHNSHSHEHDHGHSHNQYQPIDPQMINQTELYHYHPNDFQALLNATTEDDDGVGVGVDDDDDEKERNEAVERDLEMLIDQGVNDDDDDEDPIGEGGRDVVMADGGGGYDNDNNDDDMGMGIGGGGAGKDVKQENGYDVIFESTGT